MRIENKNLFEGFEIQNKKPQRDFTEDLKNFILSVDREIKKSKELKEAFLKGKDIPIYQIMIQGQKAKISLELLVKIRDEALKSYKQIINMQV